MTTATIGRDFSRPDWGSTDSYAALKAPPTSAPLRKRAFDLAVGVPLCLIAVPIIAMFAVVLAVQLRDVPFFTHERIGRNGRVFRFPKLRTLPRSTPAYADKVRTNLRPVSRFAALLRKSHLDELPQLFLVVTGRMTLVGPRPLMVSEADETPWADVRALAPQGCTGLWQVGAHQREAVADTPAYDLYYLRCWSLRMDLWIIWRTACQLVSRVGVPLAGVPRRLVGRGLVADAVLDDVVDRGLHQRRMPAGAGFGVAVA